MPLSVLIVPDKFKGTLTAAQAAGAIARGWKAARTEDTIVELPMSDGGDGFGVVLAELMEAEGVRFRARNAAQLEIESEYWRTRTGTALVESASIIGLAMLHETDRRPLNNDSTGLGLALKQIERDGATHTIVGIGGSGTNDGGFGVARQLGWRFLTEKQDEIGQWPDLSFLASIVAPVNRFSIPLTIAVDVQNPLLGATGCSRVYGPQKGLTEADLPRAEAALEQLAEVWKSQTGEDAACLQGAGAAGGLGFGLHCFAGAKIRSGFEIFAETAQLESLFMDADLVITGEGAMDRQSIMGKGVGELAKLAKSNRCRCIGLAGNLDDRETLLQHFGACSALTEITPAEHALANAAHWLEKLAHKAASNYRN